MTREQFDELVVDIDELIDFCRDYGYEGYVEDVYDEDGYDEHIDEVIQDMLENGSRWWDIRDFLDDEVNSGYQWYYVNDWGEWEPLTDSDFDEWYDNLVGMLEDDDFFESEKDEEELVEDFETELESIKNRLTPIEKEDISVDELFAACSETLLNVSQAREAGCIAEV